MSEIVKMPGLGPDMQQGIFLNWVKQVGDEVKTGEVIAEVEADKATIEIEATAEGILLEKLANPGDAVFADMPLARVGTPEELKGYAPIMHTDRQPDLETEMAQPPIVAPPRPAPPSEDGGREPAPAPEPVAVEDLPGGVKASPIARRIAQERGIDLRQVRGTGPGGRIVRADVEGFEPSAAPAAKPAAAPALAPAAAPAPKPAPAPAAPRAAPAGPDVVEEPLSRMRQRIAARTTESKQTIPHFYLTIEIDMAAALTLRKHINADLPDEQKVTVNDLVVKAAALALRKFPNLNSHFYGDKIVRHRRVNIGIAVALEGGGLLNVVAKDADALPISRLAQKNKELIAAARSGKLKTDDLEGATFTVSNLGPYDVEHFEAIISPPEAAILAVASARQVPVVVDGEIRIGTRMKASLSVDHRVSDGAEGAQFMAYLRELLESPLRLLV